MTTTPAAATTAGSSTTAAPLLEVSDVRKHFPGRGSGLFGRRSNPVKAVDGVSFVLHERETLGIVGESGCGKSTTGRVVAKLLDPTSGSIKYAGREIAGLRPGAMRPLRREIQMIFQDPYSSLNPRHTIGTIVGAPFRIQGAHPDGGIKRTVQGLMERVGLNPEHYNRYPHEFSGGQRQRIGIARALALRPKLIVCDEPVSALDVSVQAQVINLMQDLQRDRGLAYLFIAHDLSVVEHIADRVAVMYLGKIVELATSQDLYREPLMPYTQALLSAVPVADPTVKKTRVMLQGDVPSPANPPSGCVFHPRCQHPAKDAACAAIVPPLEEKAPGHWAACIKQLPTGVVWGVQQAAGGTKQPTRYLPVIAATA
jgi:oligopeptide/dipeptide ABC transporter ATP-binding protein